MLVLPVPITPVRKRSSGARTSSPGSATFAEPGEDTAGRAARRQRLLALQQEQALLKRTPGMHLLARQRISRLEEAIQHLIAGLAESE